MPDYPGLMHKMFAELEAKPGLHLSMAHLGEALSETEIRRIEATYELTVPEPLVDFYRQLGSLRFRWNFEGEVEQLNPYAPFVVGGCCDIQPLEQMIAGPPDREMGWSEILWFEDSMDDEELEERQRLRPFDFYAFDDGGFAGFRLEEKGLGESLLHASLDDDEVMDLRLNVEEYMERLLEARGFWEWPRALAYPTSRVQERLLHYIPQLFPEADLSAFG